jgi:hypothetical protein
MNDSFEAFCENGSCRRIAPTATFDLAVLANVPDIAAEESIVGYLTFIHPV